MSLFGLTKLHFSRTPILGPVLYITSIQYFLIQILVAQQWSPSYSLTRDTISDLGNTSCGTFNARFVCSPLHDLMNVSFVMLGIAMMLGSAFTFHQVPKIRSATIGLASMALSGIGVVMVGIFPENSISALHGLGAAIPFVMGNVAVIILGDSLNLPVPLRIYSFLSGACGLLALVSYASSHYLGLGEGGIERAVAYPQTVWLIVIGVYMLTRIPIRRPVRVR